MGRILRLVAAGVKARFLLAYSDPRDHAGQNARYFGLGQGLPMLLAFAGQTAYADRSGQSGKPLLGA